MRVSERDLRVGLQVREDFPTGLCELTDHLSCAALVYAVQGESEIT